MLVFVAQLLQCMLVLGVAQFNNVLLKSLIFTQESLMSCSDIVHFELRSITPMATKVNVILWSFVVLAWMRDTIDLV
jgi:hypothetical protein